MFRSLKLLALASTIVCCSVMAEKVANPMYTAWKKAGKGASVTMLSKTEMMGNTSEIETTSTLLEISDEKAVIEVKSTTTAAGQKMDLPAQKIEIPASSEAAAPQTGDAKTPEAKVETSQADVTVPAGTFHCKVTKSSSEANGMKTKVTMYVCDDVPGGTVKVESATEGSVATKTTSELVKLTKP